MPASPSLRSLHARRAAGARWNHDVEDVSRDLAAEKLAAYIRRTVEAAPPLTTEQRSRLSLLLAGGGAGDAA